MPSQYPVVSTTPGYDRNLKLWRYMGFSAFLSLLQRREDFFVRLSNVDDPYEGRFPEIMRGAFTLANMIRIRGERGFTNGYEDQTRKRCFINCWPQNEFESAAMWELYARENGISIQSTVGRLLDALDALCYSQASCPIEVSPVHYLDFDSAENSEPVIQSLNPQAFLKRPSFEHESEVRAVVTKDGIPKGARGIYVPVDLDKLIEAVYVAPNTEEWIWKIVEREIRLHSLEKVVTRSPLYDKCLR